MGEDTPKFSVLFFCRLWNRHVKNQTALFLNFLKCQLVQMQVSYVECEVD